MFCAALLCLSAVAASQEADSLLAEPRAWLPEQEFLSFKVEATFGPVRGLDLGIVTLACTQAPPPAERAEPVAASKGAPELLATIQGQASGGYLGRRVEHSITVKWYESTEPRIACSERLRGSRAWNRELRIGEREGRWGFDHRKDRHCKGCEDRAHFVEGFMPWSKPRHCDDCDSPDHRVWRDFKRVEAPASTVDIFSALYLARGFLHGASDQASISLVNQDEMWAVQLRRGKERAFDTPAGRFECVRVHLSPALAAGDGPGKEAAKRFEALFGLHGDIGLWVEKTKGFPVVIEGTAPFGPFDVHVKASLTTQRGG